MASCLQITEMHDCETQRHATNCSVCWSSCTVPGATHMCEQSRPLDIESVSRPPTLSTENILSDYKEN